MIENKENLEKTEIEDKNKEEKQEDKNNNENKEKESTEKIDEEDSAKNEAERKDNKDKNLEKHEQSKENSQNNNSTNPTKTNDDNVSPLDSLIISKVKSLNNSDNNKDLLEELNQIFTPILVMQSLEGNMADKINEAFSEASVLMEKNIIKFDDETRMAQLISICALLIARKKNSEKYQAYQKAATIKNKMKIEIQKDEYDEAKALAQKYLVNVSTTNNSSVARDAANNLLPETQH